MIPGDGCSWIFDNGGWCGMPPRAGSSYCAEHHVRVYAARGSRAERRLIAEIDALASAARPRLKDLDVKPSGV